MLLVRVPVLMLFLLEGLDSVVGVMESDFHRCSAPSFFHIDGNIIRLLLPRAFCFLSDRSFNFERERQQLSQCVQYIYLYSTLSFFVPSYPRSLSIAGLNADGTLCSLDTSMGDGGTVADTGTIFSSASQDESIAGAVAGVVQDAPEISSVLPPSTTTSTITTTITTVAPPMTTEATTITMPTTTTATTSSTTATVVSDLNPQEGSTLTSSDTPTMTMTWWNYVGWGSVPTSSESAGVVPTAAAEKRGEETEGGAAVAVEVDLSEGGGRVGPDGE